MMMITKYDIFDQMDEIKRLSNSKGDSEVDKFKYETLKLIETLVDYFEQSESEYSGTTTQPE